MAPNLTYKYIKSTLNENSTIKLKEIFSQSRKEARERYIKNPYHTRKIMHKQQLIIDCALNSIFPKKETITLIAIGGYGRGELYPYSDLDILILVDKHTIKIDNLIEKFMQAIWSSGYSIGHSVRTINELLNDVKLDTHLLTAVIESRFIAGDEKQFINFQNLLYNNPPISHEVFLYDKIKEQKNRDIIFNSDLEPNIKKSPGNLRYIHILIWLSQYFLNIHNISELISQNILTKKELYDLQESHNMLTMIRYGLHSLSKRKEDRLLRNYQKDIAILFGFHSESHNSIVQVFMQDYYQLTQHVTIINEIIISSIIEAFFTSNSDKKPINKQFQNINNLIYAPELKETDNPINILKILLLKSTSQDILGIAANTLRTSIKIIKNSEEQSLRNNQSINQLFLQILQKSPSIYSDLKFLTQIGFLDKYIPNYSRINGLIQFDLYHQSSVGEHTLKVLSNIQTILQNKFKLHSELIKKITYEIDSIEILYLAGFFHDIGKGSGEDHSIKGASIARLFCEEINISDADKSLISWLVKHHLLLSKTIRSRDIYDINTINEFCAEVRSIRYLNYLTILTIADLEATNQRLWTNWNSSMICSLYLLSRTRIESHKLLSNLKNHNDIIKATINKITQSKKNFNLLYNWVASWPRKYFMTQSSTTLRWHLENIHQNIKPSKPHVFSRYNYRINQCEITVYAQTNKHLVASITRSLDNMSLEIVDARVYLINEDYSLSQFVITSNYNPIKSELIIKKISNDLQKRLLDILSIKDLVPRNIRKRNIYSLTNNSIVRAEHPINKDYTLLYVKSPDQYGLLAKITYGLALSNYTIQYAKINTLTEQAEDYFYICDKDQKPIVNKNRLKALEIRIRNIINI